MFRLLLISVLIAVAAAHSPKVRPIVPQLDGRIVGGKPTTIQDRPYQVSLQLNGRHICGGSLIRVNAVLTAAHCTYQQVPSSLSVRVGSSYVEDGGQVHYVRSICQHGGYNPTTTDYDVAVLNLPTYVTLGNGVQLIVLQPVGQEVPINALATVSGWGTLFEGGSTPVQLQEVDVPRVAEATCKNSYGQSAITTRMSCYGWTSGGRDSCQGDSGGPLQWQGMQVGIVSWGYGCARPNYPGVYTKVSESAIRSHIDSCLI